MISNQSLLANRIPTNPAQMQHATPALKSTILWTPTRNAESCTALHWHCTNTLAGLPTAWSTGEKAIPCLLLQHARCQNLTWRLHSRAPLIRSKAASSLLDCGSSRALLGAQGLMPKYAISSTTVSPFRNLHRLHTTGMSHNLHAHAQCDEDGYIPPACLASCRYSAVYSHMCCPCAYVCSATSMPCQIASCSPVGMSAQPDAGHEAVYAACLGLFQAFATGSTAYS